MNPLMEIELEEIEQVTEEQKERFAINDINSLNWAFRKLAAIESKKSEVNLLANTEKERIEHYRESEVSKLEDNESFFNSLIEDYALRMKEIDPKFRQVTPYGTVSFRKQQPVWTYDDQKLVEYLENNEFADLVRVKKEPVKTNIKKRFKVNDGVVYDENGQAVEGIQVKEQADRLTVKVEV